MTFERRALPKSVIAQEDARKVYNHERTVMSAVRVVASQRLRG